MSITNMQKSADQVAHERGFSEELEATLARFHERPNELRIYLELAEVNQTFLIAVDADGRFVRWSVYDRVLENVTHEYVESTDLEQRDVLATDVALGQLEEWVVDHEDELAWIHPRFRWKVAQSER